MRIEELLARRTDLSTFLVHLTREVNGASAKENLMSILESDCLSAESPYGSAYDRLSQERISTDSQRVVCFTETPLEHVYLLTQELKGRSIKFEPYGIAITKMQGRKRGVNPVWYVDITQGSWKDWLIKNVNSLVESAIFEYGRDFADSDIAKLAPFIEQMGSGKPQHGKSYRKEFWWEREWRHLGDFVLPPNLIVFCPQKDIKEMESTIYAKKRAFTHFIDPNWGLERIIGRLARFSEDELGPL